MLLGKKSQDGIDLREETGEVAEALLANGYLPVETVGELPSANYYETLYEVSEDGTKLFQSFYVPPQAPRTFSKLKILKAAKTADFLTQLISFIESNLEISYIWNASNVIEDNEMFYEYLPSIATALNKTEEEVLSFLNTYCIAD